jgi:hypothetical protein
MEKHARPSALATCGARNCQTSAIWSGAVQVRYRYRIYPTSGSGRPGAAFGCARSEPPGAYMSAVTSELVLRRLR